MGKQMSPESIMNVILKTLLLSFIMVSAVAPAVAKDDPPEVSIEGLELVDKNRRGEIYSDPDIDWSLYTQVMLDPATVAFRRNWQRDQNRYHAFKVRAKDMERIKTELSQLFDEVFTKELGESGGYTITDQTGDDVMRIKPAIVDLDVYAPDTMNSPGRTTQFTESVGKMTLKLEIYDSVTGDLIALLSDRREAPRRGYMQWTTSVTNRAEARRMLQRWAKDLVKRLDEARGAGKGDS
jgi:hypothetical protein